jgi:hypothetical protein
MITFVWFIATFALVLVLRFLFTGYLLMASRLLTNSEKLGKLIYAILFFPGVVIHELSHFFTASLLNVPTGRIEIFPQKTEEGVKLGSVKVAKRDFVRNSLIGSAPFLIGSALLFLLLKTKFPQAFVSPTLKSFIQTLTNSRDWGDLLYFYLIFAVSNTMTLSKSDREGIIPTLILGSAVLIATYLISQSAINQEIVIKTLTDIFSSFAITFTLVSLVNLTFLLPVVPLVKILEKIRGKRIRLKLRF